jgi:hypothetical protein
MKQTKMGKEYKSMQFINFRSSTLNKVKACREPNSYTQQCQLDNITRSITKILRTIKISQRKKVNTII